MNYIDTEEEQIPTPNKTKGNPVIDKYFGGILEKDFKVTYIIVTERGEENNLINKLILKIFDSIELQTVPEILDKNNFRVHWNNSEIRVKIKYEYSDNNNLIWEIQFEGKFLIIENFRTEFLKSLMSDQRFKKKYCVQDEISDEISVVAYPMVRNLENGLRDYLLRFFTKKFGSKWWETSKTPQLETKIKERERTFSGMLDMQLYSIDFIDLTELIDGKAKLDPHKLLEAIDILAGFTENEEKFKKKHQSIRNDLLGNWKKFFEQHITVSNFVAIWKDLYQIRCEVAHNTFMNLKSFVKLVDYHIIISKQLSELIEELRIVKSEEYRVLEEILNINIKFSVEDIKSLLDYSIIHLTPKNFSKDTLCISEFNELLDSIRLELAIIGTFTESPEYQLNLGDDEDYPKDYAQLDSISKALFFESISELTKKALQIGIENNKIV